MKHTSDHSVITLVRLKRNLLERLELLGLEEVDFALENDLGRRRGVDTAGFDGNNDVTFVLEEVFGIEGDDTCLVRLSNISEDDIDGRE